jgi:hypothetical protein
LPIHGTPTYAPNGEFAFPRPYVKQITFRLGSNALFSQSNEQFYITDGNTGFNHIIVNFIPGLFGSNSNRYTIDHCIVDWWLIVDPSPTPIPLNFEFGYYGGASFNGPGLILTLPGWSTLYSFQLPPPPPGYWTPY